jgi:hypothetical protein
MVAPVWLVVAQSRRSRTGTRTSGRETVMAGLLDATTITFAHISFSRLRVGAKTAPKVNKSFFASFFPALYSWDDWVDESIGRKKERTICEFGSNLLIKRLFYVCSIWQSVKILSGLVSLINKLTKIKVVVNIDRMRMDGISSCKCRTRNIGPKATLRRDYRNQL